MIWIIILGLIAGYREIQILCERNSYSFQDYRKVYWNINWTSRWKNFDSFHFSNGLYALVLCISLATCTNPDIFSVFLSRYLTGFLGELVGIAYILALWVLYMYARNLMMHVILPLKPDFRYLIPLLGTLIKK